MPSSRRIPRPRPEACSLGSSEATTTRPIPASWIASSARRRAPVMAARLQRYVKGGAAEVAIAGGADRLDLGVRRSHCPVKSLRDDLRVAPDDRPDQRVRADLPPTLLGKLDRPSEMTAIGVGFQGHVEIRSAARRAVPGRGLSSSLPPSSTAAGLQVRRREAAASRRRWGPKRIATPPDPQSGPRPRAPTTRSAPRSAGRRLSPAPACGTAAGSSRSTSRS